MTGITRIKIVSDWLDWRTRLSQDFEPVADLIYRSAFGEIGISLAEGIDIVKVSKDEAKARYDWSEGIDVVLQSVSGARMTMQEKFLTYDKSTVTFEDEKTSGSPGAWYYCTAQYWFFGYTRLYWDWRNKIIFKNPVMKFQDWMILDFSALRREDAKGTLEWHHDRNRNDGRKSTFRYLYFQDVPTNCIVAQNKIYQQQPEFQL